MGALGWVEAAKNLAVGAVGKEERDQVVEGEEMGEMGWGGAVKDSVVGAVGKEEGD